MMDIESVHLLVGKAVLIVCTGASVLKFLLGIEFAENRSVRVWLASGIILYAAVTPALFLAWPIGGWFLSTLVLLVFAVISLCLTRLVPTPPKQPEKLASR